MEQIYRVLGAAKHIAFFGASVTQQQRGYVPSFATLTQVHVSQLGFGGLHLRDAVLLLDETVLKVHAEEKIDICFLEWFTSDPEIKSNDLQFLLTKLTEHTILPCLLLLYNNMDRDKRNQTKLIYERLAQANGIALIDIDSDIVVHQLFTPEFFRDDTHLHDNGGEMVAKMIYEKCYPQVVSNHLPVFKFIAFQPIVSRPTKPSGHLSIPYRAHKVEFDEIVSIPSIYSTAKLAALWLLTGPESGIIEIRDKHGKSEHMSVWDKWAHYDRFTIRRFRNAFILGDDIQIQLTDKDPDYASCTRELHSWPKRCLWIIGFSYEI
jgi:hypothetical protein